MQKVVLKKLGKEMLGQANKESSNIRSAVKGLTGIIKDSWQTIIECIPKMIRLIVELIKSGNISDKAKLTLVGALCVIGFIFAESIIGITLIFPLLVFVAGPISAIIMIPFYGTFKALILTLAVFVIIHTFNSLIESDEINKLVVSTFGEKDGKQLLADMQSIYDKLKKYLAPIAEKLRAIFEKIGRRKKIFDPDVDGEQMMRAANNKANSFSKCTDKL